MAVSTSESPLEPASRGLLHMPDEKDTGAGTVAVARAVGPAVDAGCDGRAARRTSTSATGGGFTASRSFSTPFSKICRARQRHRVTGTASA
jgi:hypothetical protein